MTQDHDDWSSAEDDALLEACFVDQSTCADTLGKRLGRDPVQVLMRVLNSDAPDMAGWGEMRCADQDAEFIGLALSGVPIGVALQWCAVTQLSDERPTHEELIAKMKRTDLRPALSVAMNLGIWFTRTGQIPAMEFLATQSMVAVQHAVKQVIERVDAPTPEIVALQLFGALPREMPVDWQSMGAKLTCSVKLVRRSRYTRKSAGQSRKKSSAGRYSKARIRT